MVSGNLKKNNGDGKYEKLQKQCNEMQEKNTVSHIRVDEEAFYEVAGGNGSQSTRGSCTFPL